jgi:CRISPR-associated protein Cmr6
MRTALHALRSKIGRNMEQGEYAIAPHQIGLSYDAFTPPLNAGKINTQQREAWLNECQEISISPEYWTFFERWKGSFKGAECRLQEIVLTSRLLMGHGNPSGADVGLTAHRIWGAPMIPGSSLKGLLANYVDAVYGPGPDGDQPEERQHWSGVQWQGRRIVGAPGKHYARIFGSPSVEGEQKAEHGGLLEFQDALYVPNSAPSNRPFAVDVLTVHQKPYYDNKGEKPPTDWYSPVPVSFITVKPGVKLLLALTGPADWTDLAMQLLIEALGYWGAGGKTAAGYGRAKRSGP